MYPWRRILIPTDFSTASEWSFDTAVDMAGSTGAELVILHVRSTWTSQPDKLRFPADDSLYSYAEQHELEKLRDHVRRGNATIQTRLLVRKAPHAGEEISRAAKSEDIDLIVMATHARHHVAHLIIGSTTMQILHEPPTPVLAIRYGVARRRDLRRIVVPVHLRQTSTAAAELAASIAGRDGAEVHLIIVCSDGEREAAEARLSEVARLFAAAPTRTFVRGKDIDAEIVRYTDLSGADALFLNAGAHPLSELKQEIIRQVSAPVMVVPA
jgi:nucleotide-binding universal stress UspA family protein